MQFLAETAFLRCKFGGFFGRDAFWGALGVLGVLGVLRVIGL